MNNSIHLDWLQRLREDLRAGDFDSLARHVELAGLDTLLDPAFVNLARQHDARQVLILLATLGMANSDQPNAYQRELAVYQYLQGQVALDTAAALCAQYSSCDPGFYAEVLTCAQSKNGLPNILAYVVNLEALQFSLELLVNVGHSHALFPLLKAWQSAERSDKPWLLACRATTARAMAAVLSRSECAVLAAVSQKLVDMAPATQSKVAQEMRVQWARLALKSRQGDMACVAAHSAFAHDGSSEHRFMLAKALVLNGQMSQALEHMQSLLETTLSDGFHAPPPVSSGEFKVSAAESTLRTVNALLRAKGVAPFLMSGTLLGYARDGALLPHDKDVDLGILGWTHQFTIAQALLEAGHFQFDLAQLSGKDRFLISAYDLRNGMAIDFFLFHEQGDHFLHGIDFDMGFTQNFKFSRFALDEVDFLDQKFFVPSNIDQNLTENYGNWQVPEKNYVVTVEAPALLLGESQSDVLLVYLELLKCVLKSGNAEKFQRVLACIEAKNDPRYAQIIRTVKKSTVFQKKTLESWFGKVFEA